jgi:hypothetical protein
MAPGLACTDEGVEVAEHVGVGTGKGGLGGGDAMPAGRRQSTSITAEPKPATEQALTAALIAG